MRFHTRRPLACQDFAISALFVVDFPLFEISAFQNLSFSAFVFDQYDHNTTPFGRPALKSLGKTANSEIRTLWLNVFCKGFTTSISKIHNLSAGPYHLTTNSPYIPLPGFPLCPTLCLTLHPHVSPACRPVLSRHSAAKAEVWRRRKSD